MKLPIGQKIKLLRKERNITQEELAEILGVSCQSVSRWELGTCYPDMELLPVLSDFFHITVDSLLGVQDMTEKKKVDTYLERYQLAISQGNIETCILIAREGVSEFPNNYALLNKLMYALFLAGDEDGNIPNWQENMEKYDEEIVTLGERIRKYCPDQEIRLEATSRLAFQHCEMGRKMQGRAIYETLPSASLCRESQMWWALEDEERLTYTREELYRGYELLSHALYNITCYCLLPDRELLPIYDKLLALDGWFNDGDCIPNSWSHIQVRSNYAALLARLGETDKALEQLKIAAKDAHQFDIRPEEGTLTTILLGTKNWKRINFETTDNRSCCEILRNKWLASPDFDGIRNTPTFHAIVESLS